MNSNYFSHDSNARNSDKIIKLRMKHKAAGYGVYFMILERLRESSNYMSVKDYNVIAFDLREDASLIKSVVEEFGLFVFTDDGKYFYSKSLTERMRVKDEVKEKRSIAGKKGMESRWKNINEPSLFDNKTNNNNNTSYNNDIANVTTEDNNKENKKEKESKENTTKVVQKKDTATKAATNNLEKRKEAFYESLKPYLSKYPKEMLRKFFDYWSEMNKSRTKMRYEQEKTWETSKRLARWASGKDFKPNSMDVGITLHDNSTDKYNNEEKWNR